MRALPLLAILALAGCGGAAADTPTGAGRPDDVPAAERGVERVVDRERPRRGRTALACATGRVSLMLDWPRSRAIATGRLRADARRRLQARPTDAVERVRSPGAASRTFRLVRGGRVVATIRYERAHGWLPARIDRCVA